MKIVDSKISLTSPIVYATDRSKAMAPVLFLFYVVCGLYFISSLTLLFSTRFFSFSIVITSLGEEGAGLCASRAFVCLFCKR